MRLCHTVVHGLHFNEMIAMDHSMAQPHQGHTVVHGLHFNEMIAALLFLLAASSRVDLIDENFEIPASDWRYVPRALTQQPAMLNCVFQSDRPDARVRLVLLSQADLNAWRVGREHEEIATTPAGPRGTLRMSVHDADTY